MSDIVYYLMPDGSKVSNDPRFDLQAALEEQLSSRPNTGDVGITPQEFTAQTQTEHPANLNSGQPGVGENAVPDDPADYIPNVGTPAMRMQKDDLAEAREAGADLTNTSTKDPAPVDSNAAVEAARKAKEEADEAVAKARAKLGEEDPGDPEVAYSEWSAGQLRFEVARRNAERDEGAKIDTSGVKKKSQLAALLDEDDASQGANPSA